MAKGAVTKLKFNSPIISTSDQLISTNELLDRLKALHEELASGSRQYRFNGIR